MTSPATSRPRVYLSRRLLPPVMAALEASFDLTFHDGDDPPARARSARLMAAVDALNQSYGRNTLRTGVCGTAPRWGMKSENRSACFTTRWDELPQAR